MLNAADDLFRERLSALLPDDVLRPAPPAYLEEPRRRFTGRGGVLALPRNADDVSTIVRSCAAAGVGIVPYGGGTGLVGGQVMPAGPVPLIMSLERMACIRSVDPIENTLVAEAGVLLQSVQESAGRAGRLFPLAIASQGTARIGGVLATNAGGVNTLRYGNARALCLGLEAVLPNGDIWRGLSALRKDNLGYDLRDLLIGSEGTLGIITAASLRLYARPATQAAALLAVPDPAAALRLLSLAHERLGDNISAFELMNRQGLDFISETLPDVRLPFRMPPDWAVLIDLGAPAALPLADRLDLLFEEGAETGLILDGWLARSEAHRADFWAVREALPAANRRIGAISSHDISVPLGAIPEFIERAAPLIRAVGDFRINCFGHVGDGNLHYNVFPARDRRREAFEAQRDEIRRAVHDLVHELGGSVAAEHGVGRLKVRDMRRYADPAGLSAMRAVKGALDPAGIMNPGAIFAA